MNPPPPVKKKCPVQAPCSPKEISLSSRSSAAKKTENRFFFRTWANNVSAVLTKSPAGRLKKDCAKQGRPCCSQRPRFLDILKSNPGQKLRVPHLVSNHAVQNLGLRGLDFGESNEPGLEGFGDARDEGFVRQSSRSEKKHMQKQVLS